MINSMTDHTVLNNGVKMPWLGFGVFKVRSLDTATIYGNERGVGNAMAASGIPRGEIFLTTKVWNDDQRAGRVMEAFEESLALLGTDYVDLYLIHWPVRGRYKETWTVLEEIYRSGRARAIGVSNFLVHHLEDLLADAEVVPAVDQVEFHPRLLQPDLLKFCREHGVQMEAWSPLMQGQIISEPRVQQLAAKYGRTPAQIVLRWDLQHGVVTIPKSVRTERIVENSQIFDFELAPEDVAALDALDENRRVGSHPDTFNF
jgi:diketogulonate reductase-like aldo/keto reductase